MVTEQWAEKDGFVEEMKRWQLMNCEEHAVLLGNQDNLGAERREFGSQPIESTRNLQLYHTHELRMARKNIHWKVERLRWGRGKEQRHQEKVALSEEKPPSKARLQRMIDELQKEERVWLEEKVTLAQKPFIIERELSPRPRVSNRCRTRML